MTAPRFAAGQTVQFSPDRRAGGTGAGRYTVVRQLPDEGSTQQYRIKSKADGTERVVLESQLVRAAI